MKEFMLLFRQPSYDYSGVSKEEMAALAEADKLSLEDNHFYFVLLGELYRNTDPQKAKNISKKRWMHNPFVYPF